MKDKKYSLTQMCLTVLSVVCLVISNIITVKQVQLPFGIITTGGFFIFPMTYILSDIFSEVYGYKWSRMTCYMSFAANLLCVIMFYITISTKAPDFYQDGEAFRTVLGSTPRTLVASLTAFLMGDFVNDKIFEEMRKKHEDHSRFGIRAILSSLGGELADSIIFYPLCFWGTMPIAKLISMAITEVVLKVSYEIIIFPLTHTITKAVIRIEEKA